MLTSPGFFFKEANLFIQVVSDNLEPESRQPKQNMACLAKRGLICVRDPYQASRYIIMDPWIHKILLFSLN